MKICHFIIFIFIAPRICLGGKKLRSRKSKKSKAVCKKGSRLHLSVRCEDASELLYNAPMDLSRYAHDDEKKPDACASDGVIEEWAMKATCLEHGGFQQILPYYTGCYPKDSELLISLIPSVDVDHIDSDEVVGYLLPPMNVANSDFEDADLGLEGWDVVVLGPELSVRQKNDNFPQCDARGMCLAYEGTGYALVSAGDAMDGVTPPNSISRNDFRVPLVDRKVCQTDVKFCLSFAMRFMNKETYPVSESGNNDFFTVEVQVGDNGKMLFERTISSADIERVAENTVRGSLGDDGGWEFVQIELPDASFQKPIFFTLRAMTTNVGDFALDSVGYIDAINIAPCMGTVINL